jgi:hydroxymethylbilane synthase
MTAPQKITLGTRGSELALTQTSMVTALLNEAHPGLEVVRNIITTSGDKRQDLRFAEFAAATGGVIDKGIFIKELEIALEDHKIDAAVHSLKDVPSDLESHFTLTAILKRASIEDVLITAGSCASIQDLPKGARVGTSSVRRARQLKWMRPDLQIVEIRGNVPTRVKKVISPAGEALDAVMLAAAGLERLGLMQPGSGKIEIEGTTLNSVVLDCQEFLPAAGQGAIAIEVLQRNSEARDALQALNHPETAARVQAEREFLKLLGAGCQTPVGARTWVEGGQLHMRVRVFSEQNESAPPQELEAANSIESPRTLATKLASQVIRR